MTTMGGRIAYARAARGLTQEQLGNKIGATKGAISQWERGNIKVIGGALLYELSKALEVSGDWLQKGHPYPMGKPQHLDPEEAGLIATFRLLESRFRDAMIVDANKYLALSDNQQPSLANPYPKSVKPKK